MAQSSFNRPSMFILATGLVLFAGLALWFATNFRRFDAVEALDLPRTFVLGALQSTEPVPGYPAIADLDQQITLAGEPFVVNFFASWCKGCAEEHANILAFDAANKGRVIGVVYEDTAEAAARFLDKVRSPYLAVGVDADGVNAKNFAVSGLPETYIVLGDGTLFHRSVGPLTGERLDAFMEKWNLSKNAKI